MKYKQSDIEKQGVLPLYGDRPILDFIVPVRVENWRADGLFRRGRYSVGQKARFVMHIRAAAFDYSSRAFAEARSDTRGTSRTEIAVFKKISQLKKFDAVRDPEMRQIMANMIISEKLLDARYIAKKLRRPWPAFVMDFNEGLEQMMDTDTFIQQKGATDATDKKTND